MNELNNKRRMVLESVRNLSLSYREIVKIIPEFCVIEDELLDDFSTSFEFVDELEKSGMLNEREIFALTQMNSYIESQSDMLVLEDPNTYDNRRIDFFPFWLELRRLAVHALSVFVDAES